MPGNAVALAGTDGVGLGYMKLWDCIPITEFDAIVPESTAKLIGLKAGKIRSAWRRMMYEGPETYAVLIE